MSQTDTVTKTSVKTALPSMWRVVLHNDDFTPFDFVTSLLTSVFRKGAEEAHDIALLVHTKGRAIVGLYTKEIAETKVMQSSILAEQNGHPLLLTSEPA